MGYRKRSSGFDGDGLTILYVAVEAFLAFMTGLSYFTGHTVAAIVFGVIFVLLLLPLVGDDVFDIFDVFN